VAVVGHQVSRTSRALSGALQILREGLPDFQKFLRRVVNWNQESPMQADVSAKPKNAPRALGRLSPGRSTVIVGISDEVGAVSSQLQIEALMNPGAKLRVHMRTELTDRHRRLGVTFINVTHNQVEAMTLSNRVALMDEGRIVQHGTPSALYHDPSDLRAARFIGILAINILRIRQRPAPFRWPERSCRSRSRAAAIRRSRSVCGHRRGCWRLWRGDRNSWAS